jgi:SAM-dependent methyltransferase
MVPRGPRGAEAGRFPEPTRPVAAIVAPRWSSEDSRDDAGEAARVFEIANVTTGTNVADIGAGDGYYAVRAAARVAPDGRVWAEDIEPDYLALLQKRLRQRPQRNLVLTLGEPHDPRLPARSVDVALLIHMYHEITQPFGLLYNLAGALRPDARVVILDTTRPTTDHGTPPELLRCELEAMGYRRVRQVPTAPGEYVAVFAPPATPAALTPPDSVAARLAARGCAEIATRAASGAR